MGNRKRYAHHVLSLRTALVVLAVLGLLGVASGPVLAGEHLLLQNTDTGQTGFFNLKTDGTFRNKTRSSDASHEGWDTLTKNAPRMNTQMRSDWRLIPGVSGTPASTAAGGGSRLFWQNSRGVLGWWKLNANGVLGTNTNTSYNFVSELWPTAGGLNPSPYQAFVVAKDKQYPAIVNIASAPLVGPTDAAAVLYFHHTDAGQIAFYNVDSNGYLPNLTKGKGWDVSGTIAGLTAANGWRAAPFVLTKVGPEEKYDLLYFNNASTGQAGYVRLEYSTGKMLTNPTSTTPFAVEKGKESYEVVVDATTWVGIGGGDGKGWTPVALTTACNKTLFNDTTCLTYAGVLNSTTKNNRLMFWHNTATGKVAWWALNTNGVPKVKGGSNGTDFALLDNFDNADFLLTKHQVVGLHEKPDMSSNLGANLIIQNTEDGKNFWWKLDTNAKLKNRTQDNGWGYYWTDLPKAWRLRGMDKNSWDQERYPPEQAMI